MRDRLRRWVLVPVLIAGVATFSIETAFLAAASAKRIDAAGVHIPIDVKAVTAVWLLVGYPSDVAFNLTRGTVLFREWPQELLFSHRVARHMDDRGWRGEKAREWASVMNAADPDHIKRTD